jgi:hypothetical protein
LKGKLTGGVFKVSASRTDVKVTVEAMPLDTAKRALSADTLLTAASIYQPGSPISYREARIARPLAAISAAT